MDKVVDTIERIKAALPQVRKAVVALVGAAVIILGTDSTVLADIIAVLTALGVYGVANQD